MMNTGLTIRNRSGHRGVSWSSEKNKWVAAYKNRFIGYYDDIKDAANAYREIYEKDQGFPLTY